MATADQIRVLIQAHYARDDARFRTTALQIAAGIKDPQRREQLQRLVQNQLVALPIEAHGLTSPAPAVQWSDLVLSAQVSTELEYVCFEHQHIHELLERGLRPRNRLLFHGPPGNGKTSAAAALAAKLGRQAVVASLPNLVQSYMGATSQQLHKLFAVLRCGMVLVLDELDSLGSTRGGSDLSGSSKEHNVIVNTLLTLLDEQLDGILIATTNRVDMLDSAVIRRFDEQLEFGPPEPALGEQLIRILVERHRVTTPPQADKWESYDAITKAVQRQARTELRAALGVQT